MAQMLLLRRPLDMARRAPRGVPGLVPRRPSPDAGAPARGILLAVALSSGAWIGLALLMARGW